MEPCTADRCSEQHPADLSTRAWAEVSPRPSPLWPEYAYEGTLRGENTYLTMGSSCHPVTGWVQPTAVLHTH